MKKPNIVCVTPPFYRLIESKNNRISPAMHYIAQILFNSNFPVTLINGDYADESVDYCDRYSMYQNNWLFEERYHTGGGVFDETVSKILKYNPQIVIISAGDVLLPTVEMGNAQSCALIAAGIKKFDKKIKCIGYGHLLKYASSNLLKDLDFIITSECEDLILAAIENNAPIHDNWSTDLDSLPLLSTEYIAQPINKYDFDYIMSMRGCTHNCKFCLQSDMRQRIDTFSVAHFEQELLYRIERLGLKTFYFSDMIFLPYKDSRKQEMLSMLKQLKQTYTDFRWCCEERIDSLTDEDYLHWYESGCYHIKYGVESLNQEILNTLGKHINYKEILHTFKKTKEVGLGTTAYVLLGCPGFSDNDYLRMLELFVDLKADNYVININVPYWGTKLHQQIQTSLEHGTPYHSSEEGLFHLSAEMSRLWGISQNTIEQYFNLQTNKEDHSYRKYVRKVVNPKVFYSENRIEYF